MASSTIKRSKSNGCDILPSLSYDILGRVMSFLPLKDLFNFAFLCKTLSQAVTIPMVVRSALFAGGYSMISMNELYKVMKSRSIHPPSPLRLLRLSVGKKCEICLNELNKKRARHVRKGFGLFVCWHCTTKRQCSKGFRKKGDDYWDNQDIYDSILDNKRTANKIYGWRSTGPEITPEQEARERERAENQSLEVRVVRRLNENRDDVYDDLQVRDYINYLWKRPMVDNFGEKIGPILCFTDLPRMINSMMSLVALEPSNTLESNVIQCFKLELHAPHKDNYKYIDFIETYEDTINKAKAYHEDLKWQKTRKTSDYKIKKLTSCKRIVDILTEMITIPHVRKMLHYEINEWFIRTPVKYRDIPPILFRELWLRQYLLDLIIIPSKVKRTTLKRVAREITEKYK